MEGTCTRDYQQMQASVFIEIFIFAIYTSIFERFHLLRFRGHSLDLQVESFCFGYAFSLFLCQREAKTERKVFVFDRKCIRVNTAEMCHFLFQNFPTLQ